MMFGLEPIFKFLVLDIQKKTITVSIMTPKEIANALIDDEVGLEHGSCTTSARHLVDF